MLDRRACGFIDRARTGMKHRSGGVVDQARGHGKTLNGRVSVVAQSLAERLELRTGSLDLVGADGQARAAPMWRMLSLAQRAVELSDQLVPEVRIRELLSADVQRPGAVRIDPAGKLAVELELVQPHPRARAVSIAIRGAPARNVKMHRTRRDCDIRHGP